jgi:hypothetical protein
MRSCADSPSLFWEITPPVPTPHRDVEPFVVPLGE